MTEHVDVVVVGAGISGISAAWHLRRRCPVKTYVVLEQRADLGGTWDLFRYPGVRSDSDMFTLGLRFKPWTARHWVGRGPEIKAYLHEAVAESGIGQHIRYGHRLIAADWSDTDSRWTLTVAHGGGLTELTCSFLFWCSGYYDHDAGHTPHFAGADDFGGQIVHPQHWPDDLDYTGKKIIVVGSGATAITLVPALANSGAGHVTMLQRSPTYIASLPPVDPFTVAAQKLLPTRAAYAVNRWKGIVLLSATYHLSRWFPNPVRRTLTAMARNRLPADYDVATHFGPRYRPWDERLCLAPGGDLFAAITAGRVQMVTDTIETFTATGIRLGSGRELAADVIVTATGLNMRLFGGAALSRNGIPVNPADAIAYQGMMLTGLPNTAFTVGYTNISWTLKADLVSGFVCRLLSHMDARGLDTVEPARPGDDVEQRPFTDFTPGYIRRTLSHLPKTGSRAPWLLTQNYLRDRRLIRRARIDDEHLRFASSVRPSGQIPVQDIGELGGQRVGIDD